MQNINRPSNNLNENIAHGPNAGPAEHTDPGNLDLVNVSGSVSEFLKEAGESSPASAGSGSKGDDSPTPRAKKATMTIEEMKADLLKRLPKQRIQVEAEIIREIHKEIDSLMLQAKKISSSANVNYFELNNVMRKVRDLKEVLSSIVKASYDHVKALWLRFVHGLM